MFLLPLIILLSKKEGGTTAWGAALAGLRLAADEAEPRFVIILFDPRETRPWIKGPDGGEDYAGYTESELRGALAGKYGLSSAAINAVIQNAKNPPVTTYRN